MTPHSWYREAERILAREQRRPTRDGFPNPRRVTPTGHDHVTGLQDADDHDAWMTHGDYPIPGGTPW